MIRVATREDLAGVLAVYRVFRSYNPAFDASAAGACWEAIERSGVMTVVVGEVAGVIAATCTLLVVPNLTWSGRPWAMIENVATDPAYQRRGLGRAVLGFACERAWGAGCYKVSLATGSVEAATLRFYEEAGFIRGGKSFFEIRRA